MEPGNGLAQYRPLWPGEEGWPGNTPGTGRPQDGYGGIIQLRGKRAGCGESSVSPCQGHGKAFGRARPKNKDVPQPCRGRPCKFWCERRDLNPYG